MFNFTSKRGKGRAKPGRKKFSRGVWGDSFQNVPPV